MYILEVNFTLQMYKHIITPTPTLQHRAPANTAQALTTIFEPPQSCLDAPFTLGTSSSGLVGFWTAWKDYYDKSSECYPPSFSKLQWNWTWYSPGVCPSGYNVAQTSTPTDSIGVTQAWCCPSSGTITGWRSGDSTYQACTFLASDTTVISTQGSSRATLTPSFSFVAMQWPISVEWASSDLARFTPASAPMIQIDAASTIAQLTGTVMSGGPGRTGTVPASGEAGMSTGEAAGVAVGSIVVLLAIVTGILCWICRRRRTRHRTPDETDKGTRWFDLDARSEHANILMSQSGYIAPVELAARNLDLHELGGNHAMNTRKVETVPAELDSTSHHDRPPG